MSATEPIDVRDMAIVHKTFRNGFTESAQLVRANPTPSSKRVTFLADHIDFAIGMLHHHHASEDELLYPLLIERVPEQRETTEHVAAEHQQVAGAIDAATDACKAWRSEPGRATGYALANALDNLNEVLQPHLDDEESKSVPLAAVTLTEDEWNAIGEHSRTAIPRNKMPVAFGMVMEPLNADEQTLMKSHLPTPIRLLYPLLIQRPWNKYADTLRNGT
jgi:hemerythrin-like domain-containing protein